jgi:hypothetical protein
MPYTQYQQGGYKSLDCGYGWKKMEDGSCGRESWVRSHSPDGSVYDMAMLMHFLYF